MAHVDLQETVRNGSIGDVRLGDRRSRVIAVFGEPTDIARGRSIIRYGTFEFHFAGEALWLVHCDAPLEPWSFGGLVSVDPWVIARGRPLGDVETACRTAGLPTERAARPDPGQIRLHFDCGVTLGFDTDTPDSRAEPPLCCVSLSRR